MDWMAPAPGDTLIAIAAPTKASHSSHCITAVSGRRALRLKSDFYSGAPIRDN